MGLNDLTLEKLIGEINGYKDKLRTIHEEYGRASQDLQDRINVLGYTLNEHLRETKDQISNTPQRLLNLETKYVTGEVTDGEYRHQREEFKGLLDSNLKNIEEIRSMISVLQQMEVKPLTPADLKQATSANVSRPTSEDWGRGAVTQDKTFTIPQAIPHPFTPLPTGLRIAPAQPNPERIAPSESSLPTSSPSPPQPESNGNSWTNPAPQPSNASETIAPPVMEESQLAPEPTPSLTSSPELLTSSPTSDLSATTSEDSVGTVSTVDIVEASDVDDTLMVKVVDDVPSLEASAAVVLSDTTALQSSPLTGADTATVAPAAPDLAQVSLTPPTQFYKVVCPKCGADVPKPAKVWELKGGKSKKNVLIGLFQCQDCRVKFREALTREII